MARKPTIAGLKREIQALGAELHDVRTERRQVQRALETAESKIEQLHEQIKDLHGDVHAAERCCEWHQNLKSRTLDYFDQYLALMKPELLPDQHTGLHPEGQNSHDRFLLNVRERLTRHYSPIAGMSLYEGRRRDHEPY